MDEIQKEINALKGAHMDRQCYERGCACIYYGVDNDMVAVEQRNDVLEEVAKYYETKNMNDISKEIRSMKR
mgnify:CR=1 FL=1